MFDITRQAKAGKSIAGLDQQRLCFIFSANAGEKLPQIEGGCANGIQAGQFLRQCIGLREIMTNAFEGFLIVDALRCPDARSVDKNMDHAIAVA